MHPTQKPIKLLKRLLQIHSKEGDIIVDPFCGSGTTGLACIDLNRQFILNDLDPKYNIMAKTNIYHKLTQLTLNFNEAKDAKKECISEPTITESLFVGL